MSAAAIGLIGVIIGALLGGVVSSYVEARKRIVSAQAPGRLIIAELETVQRRIKSAIADGNWWQGDLPSDAWKDSSKDLAPGVARSTLRRLYDTYTLLEGWDSRRAEPFPAPDAPVELGEPPTARAADDAQRPVTLTETLGAVSTVQRDLQKDLESPPGATLRIAALVVLVLLAVALVVEAAVERPQFSDRMVAAALQARIGSLNSVECKGDGSDNWRCPVTEFATTVHAHCLDKHLTRSKPPAPILIPTARLPVVCETGHVTLTVTRTINGSLDVVADPASATEQREIIDFLMQPEKESVLGEIWRKLKGVSR